MKYIRLFSILICIAMLSGCNIPQAEDKDKIIDKSIFESASEKISERTPSVPKAPSKTQDVGTSPTITLVRDVRLDEFPTVTLNGKGQKIRYVPIMSKTAELLRKYTAENYLNKPDRLDNPLFVNRQKQKLTRAGIAYILNKYADGRDVSPHILRHTKAMHLLQSGVNIVFIRDILGHASIETTDIYARADAEMKRKAIEKLAAQVTPDIPDWRSDNALINWLKALC